MNDDNEKESCGSFIFLYDIRTILLTYLWIEWRFVNFFMRIIVTMVQEIVLGGVCRVVRSIFGCLSH